MTLLSGVILALSTPLAAAQAPTAPIDPARIPKAAAPVERLGPNQVRVGSIQIDMARREASVKGVVNNAWVLEFIANTKGGFKAYESALELDTNGINFNLAMILLGLDPERSVAPKFQFDPATPKGDPVELWVEWGEGGGRKRIRAEELVYNERTQQTLSPGPWVYTGSVFMKENNAYMADVDGVLVGFVHTPAPIIESPRLVPPGTYGDSYFNRRLGLEPGMAVTFIVRALPRK